jgi:hypothetical protein
MTASSHPVDTYGPGTAWLPNLAASLAVRSAESWGMSALTRRRNPDARQETWQVYCGDVRVGSIAMRSGNPTDTDPWGWRCGFYPGSEPGDCTSGTAASFDQARRDFEEAWRVFLANRTEADFDEYRKHRAWTAWKYAMWDSGCKLPTQLANGRSTCFCGAAIDIKGMSRHVHVAHLEAA